MVIEKMMKNAKDFKIDLTAKDLNGKTGFQLAEKHVNKDITNIIKIKMPIIAF